MNKVILLLTFLSYIFCSSSDSDEFRVHILESIAKEKPKFIHLIKNVSSSIQIIKDFNEGNKTEEIIRNFEKDYPKIREYLEDTSVTEDYYALNLKANRRHITTKNFYSFGEKTKYLVFGKIRMNLSQKLVRRIALWKRFGKEHMSSTFKYVFLKEVLAQLDKRY